MTDDPERAAALAGRLAEAGLRATITRTRTTPAAIEPIHEEDA
jgi:hypothetical protein